MQRFLGLAIVLCGFSTLVLAQPYVQPTTQYKLVWEHSGANTDHYEVRYAANATWTNVGKPASKSVVLPVLAAGAFTGQVRACATSSSTVCSGAVAVPFTVQAVTPPAPTVPPNPTAAHIEPVTPTPNPEPNPNPQPAGAPAFANGWENLNRAGCDNDVLVDRVYAGPQHPAIAWADYGGAGACQAGEAAIVTTEHSEGSHALQVTQRPGQQNGTDFRILQTAGNQSEITLSFDIKFASNFTFANADMKMAILMDGGLNAQNIYINTRGNRVCVGVTPADTVYCDNAHPLSVGSWHTIKAYAKAGANGLVRVKIDGVISALVYDAGNEQANWPTVNTGSLGGFKLDTTYNQGSAIRENMNLWYDNVKAWTGANALGAF